MCNLPRSRSPYVRSKRSWIANVGCGWWCVWLVLASGVFWCDNPYFKGKALVGAFTLLALFRKG